MSIDLKVSMPEKWTKKYFWRINVESNARNERKKQTKREKERKRKTNTHNELNQFSGVKFPEHKCTKWMPGWWWTLPLYTPVSYKKSSVLSWNEMQIFQKKGTKIVRPNWISFNQKKWNYDTFYYVNTHTYIRTEKSIHGICAFGMHL